MAHSDSINNPPTCGVGRLMAALLEEISFLEAHNAGRNPFSSTDICFACTRPECCIHLKLDANLEESDGERSEGDEEVEQDDEYPVCGICGISPIFESEGDFILDFDEWGDWTCDDCADDAETADAIGEEETGAADDKDEESEEDEGSEDADSEGAETEDEDEDSEEDDEDEEKGELPVLSEVYLSEIESDVSEGDDEGDDDDEYEEEEEEKPLVLSEVISSDSDSEYESSVESEDQPSEHSEPDPVQHILDSDDLTPFMELRDLTSSIRDLTISNQATTAALEEMQDVTRNLRTEFRIMRWEEARRRLVERKREEQNDVDTTIDLRKEIQLLRLLQTRYQVIADMMEEIEALKQVTRIEEPKPEEVNQTADVEEVVESELKLEEVEIEEVETEETVEEYVEGPLHLWRQMVEPWAEWLVKRLSYMLYAYAGV